MARCFHYMLLLVFMSSGTIWMVNTSDSPLSCGYDVNCQAIAQLISTVNSMKDKQDVSARFYDLTEKFDKLARTVQETSSKQTKDLEKLSLNVNTVLASTTAISTQLGKHSADLMRHDDRLKAHESMMTNVYQRVQSMYLAEVQDCGDIRKMGFGVSGVYQVYPRGIRTDVFCDFRSSTESWLVFQRRKDGSVDFNRNWNEYANGFGTLTGEFWLGNDKLSLLMTNRKYKLRIELEDFTGQKRFAEYSTFSVKPSTDKYRLTVGGYTGNAVDSFGNCNGMVFSAKDWDNDPSTEHCAQRYRSGWWYNRCYRANLNGLYLRGSHSRIYEGVAWLDWKGDYYSLKATEMKITPVL